MSETNVLCCRKDDGCEGVLDLQNGFNLQTGCRSSTAVFPCTSCGRVATVQGVGNERVSVGMYRRSGEEVYLKNDELVYKESSEKSDDS